MDARMIALALAPHAGVLSLLGLVLTLRVIGARRRAQVALGTGGNPAVERAVRVHGNFMEYTPLGLFLIFLVGVTTGAAWSTHVLGLILVIGRAFHAWGVSRHPERLIHRVIGMSLTMLVLAVCGLTLAAVGLWSLNA